MKVVMNALPFKQQSSGIGILINQLFGRLPQYTGIEWLTLLSQDSPTFGTEEECGAQYRIPFHKGENIKRNLYQTFIMGRRFCRDAVFLTTDSKVPLIMPHSAKIISVVTDLAVYRMPEVYQHSRVLYWKAQYRYLSHRAKRFIAISECTKQDMVELLCIPSEIIDVIPCAAASEIVRVDDTKHLSQVRKKYGLPVQYILFVGNFNPRKNLERLLLAFDQLKEETNLPHKLIIVGEHGWKFSKESALSKLRHKDEIVFAGYISDGDLPAFYTMADLFVFPSLHEGFGIPILEAQQCGAPVLAGNNSAMPEVGGSGAIYVDVYSPQEIYKGIKRILEDANLQSQMRERGYENASRFSWEASAKKLYEIIKAL